MFMNVEVFNISISICREFQFIVLVLVVVPFCLTLLVLRNLSLVCQTLA